MTVDNLRDQCSPSQTGLLVSNAAIICSLDRGGMLRYLANPGNFCDVHTIIILIDARDVGDFLVGKAFKMCGENCEFFFVSLLDKQEIGCFWYSVYDRTKSNIFIQ